jgi:hypothetical protein
METTLERLLLLQKQSLDGQKVLIASNEKMQLAILDFLLKYVIFS